ncbi:MAG TPA: protoporphyrinogen oxidase [Gemmatimonadales bacterium]|nr:protoporphyrinogen oxidase [Gemmatimonadales bacterium]
MSQVVIVGGGIAGLAAAQRLTAADIPCAVLERDHRPGGKIVSQSVGGFLVEGGPDCFLSSKPGGMALARTLGIDGLLHGTDSAHRGTFVKRGGRLHPLPEGITGLVPSRLGPLLTTRLLTPAGRIRAGLEAFVRGRTGGGDESIAQFASRRFGAEAYRWVVEPLLSGVYAGDGAQLSLSATFPQLARAEREGGGVLRSTWRTGGGTSQGERGGFLSFPDGMEQLVRSTVARLPPSTLRLGEGVVSISTGGEGFRISCADGAVAGADHVILATPAFVSAELVEDLSPSLSIELSRIPFVSSATVTLAYRDAPAFRGTGYVCPRAEGGPVVAVTWASNKYRGRAPAGAALARVFLGRSGDEGWVDESDDVLIAEAREELAQVCGVEGEPVLGRVFRWPRGLPQYVIGHLERVERIAAQVRRIPGLHLAGASYRGVGIPDCIASGWAAADAVLGALRIPA